MTKRWMAVAVAALCGVAVLGACGQSNGGDPVTVTVTASSSSPPSSAHVPSSTPAVTTSAAGAAQLQRSWAKLAGGLTQPVSVSIVAVGDSTTPINFGDAQTLVAWSTIKVPLAIAAERKNGPMPATVAAIEQSDNASAESLWSSLGSPQQASAAVMKVLAEGGDSTTVVPTERLRAGFTVFGQTQWPLQSAATFTAHLPCLKGAGRVVGLMGQVAGNQQWGVEIMKTPKSTAVKGGWGPGPTSGYVVRQIGLITRADGTQTAIAMSTLSAGSSLGSGTAALDKVARWLNANLKSLPSGKCGA